MIIPTRAPHPSTVQIVIEVLALIVLIPMLLLELPRAWRGWSRSDD